MFGRQICSVPSKVLQQAVILVRRSIAGQPHRGRYKSTGRWVGHGVGVAGRGVEWCGMVWCGVVWCGVVWCGVVWCGVVWCGVVWRDVVWCGVVWCDVRLALTDKAHEVVGNIE